MAHLKNGNSLSSGKSPESQEPNTLRDNNESERKTEHVNGIISEMNTLNLAKDV